MSRDPQTDGPSVLCFVSTLPPLLCPSPTSTSHSHTVQYRVPPVKAEENHARFFESWINDSIQDAKLIIP